MAYALGAGVLGQASQPVRLHRNRKPGFDPSPDRQNRECKIIRQSHFLTFAQCEQWDCGTPVAASWRQKKPRGYPGASIARS
jgi:hypothetical protein